MLISGQQLKLANKEAWTTISFNKCGFYSPLWHTYSPRSESRVLTWACGRSLMFDDDLLIPMGSPELCYGINHRVKTLQPTASSPSALSAHTLGCRSVAGCPGSSESLRFSLRSLPRSLPLPRWSDTSFGLQASTSSKYLWINEENVWKL